ncbi:MAG: amino acid permease [Melioribacteraceae bacterium]|nr:amino acid permease [Melioribacteraceae bacterium]
MAGTSTPGKKLKKNLGLFSVYAIATGTTLSSGLFLLPGIAAEQAGPALIFSYLIAAIPFIPAILCIVELGTAMPKAGGVYYFLDRTMGPMLGTIGGIGTWLALVLKVAFALIGMGAYISLFVDDVKITEIAVVLAFMLAGLNLLGSKKTSGVQIGLVAILLTILSAFIIDGFVEINPEHFNNLFNVEMQSILSTAGLVYVSYVGMTKVASLSEEIEDPERNLPIGIFLAMITSFLIYGLGTFVIVGVVPMDILTGDLTPVATAADIMAGEFGVIFVSIAALLSFISVANAGVMSSSRYPLAMSRDHILPSFFRKMLKNGAPINSIIITTLLLVVILIFFDPTKIAKLASAFQLLMFALVCLAVIVMRESRIDSYDPGYKSPWYPWLQVVGIISPMFLIFEMGWVAILFSLGLVVAAVLWYNLYAKVRVRRSGAMYHIFERLGKQRYDGLDTELRGIMKEKGLRSKDPFDEIVTRSNVLIYKDRSNFEDILVDAAELLAKKIPISKEKIVKMVLDGTRVGATPVTRGVALPHFRASGISNPEMILVRSEGGIKIKIFDPLTGKEESEEFVNAIFFLASPEENPSLHLRILAQIAGRVDDPTFSEEWLAAKDEQQLKEALLHDERFLSLTISKTTLSESLITKQLKDVQLPDGCLVALLQRGGDMIIPDGKLVFHEGDRLTIIGEKAALKKLRAQFLT